MPRARAAAKNSGAGGPAQTSRQVAEPLPFGGRLERPVVHRRQDDRQRRVQARAAELLILIRERRPINPVLRDRLRPSRPDRRAGQRLEHSRQVHEDLGQVGPAPELLAEPLAPDRPTSAASSEVIQAINRSLNPVISEESEAFRSSRSTQASSTG